MQQGVLDMRRQEWMGQMVDHIEAMRDASPTRETRISLSPEALGKVDVSIRQDGDRIHVHFATETRPRASCSPMPSRASANSPKRAASSSARPASTAAPPGRAEPRRRGKPAPQPPLVPQRRTADSAAD
jgi:hypothetical protein